MFKEVVYSDQIGDSPAAVNLRSGSLHINPEVFYRYPIPWRKFIVLHELGHYRLQTKSELAADAYAFHHFVKEGHSLKDAVEALYRVLDKDNPAHAQRIQEQLDKALWWDAVIYNKELKSPKERKAAMQEYLQEEQAHLAYCLGKGDHHAAKDHMVNILLTVDPKIQESLMERFSTAIADIQLKSYKGAYLDDMAYFFCFGNKACQERKRLKAEARADLIKSRGIAKELKAQAKLTKSEATKSLADQGVDSRANIGKNITNTISGVAGAAANVLTGGRVNIPTNANDLIAPIDNPTPVERPNRTGLYVGLGAVSLIVIGVLVYFILRKKK